MSLLSARLGGSFAILFVVAMVVGVILATDSPNTDAPDQEWINYVRDDSNLVRNLIGGYLMVIAGLLFLVFLVAMYQRLRAAEGGDGGWSLVMLASGIGWAIALAIGAVLTVTIAGGIKFGSGPEPTPETARWFSQLGFPVFLVAGGLCAALSTAVMSTLIVRTKIVPAWVGYFGYIAAVAMVLAAFFVPMIMFALWMLAAGIALLMSKDEPMGAPATA